MVVYPLKQPSNIQKHTTNKFFEHLTNRTFHVVRKIPTTYFLLKKSQQTRRVFFFFFIFVYLGIFHNFHCLGSHARGNWSYYWPAPCFRAASAARTRGDLCSTVPETCRQTVKCDVLYDIPGLYLISGKCISFMNGPTTGR